jgi:hypothetical protein
VAVSNVVEADSGAPVKFSNATMQQAVAAEFAAKRVFQCPLDVKWLTKQPTNYAESREKARQKTYSSKQVRDFEAYQNHVLRRCEGLSL